MEIVMKRKDHDDAMEEQLASPQVATFDASHMLEVPPAVRDMAT
jgi:hypothetical protein